LDPNFHESLLTDQQHRDEEVVECFAGNFFSVVYSPAWQSVTIFRQLFCF